MYEWCIIAPSHLSIHNLKSQSSEDFFEGALIYSLDGLANWSDSIRVWTEGAIERELPVYWMVSDWRFNNRDLVLFDEASTFLPGARGHHRNIDSTLISTEHVSLLAKKGVQILDHMVTNYPSVKLIFWCLYQRTRNHTSKTVPPEYAYDAMVRRYPNNVLDIDAFLNRFDVSFQNCVLDEGGHPNKLGYRLLSSMIRPHSHR
jgi:hypothetical protein